MFDKACDSLHMELDQIEQKLADGKTRMTNQDLADIDKIAHALKCLATYEAMKGGSEYGGDSYARGRSRTTGRYVSRDGGSYDGGAGYYQHEVPDGYSRRY